MFLHIGEGIMVNKKDIIAILDVEKITNDGRNQLFLDNILGEAAHINEEVKSLIVVNKGTSESATMVFMSAISTTTLQKRFHGTIEAMMDIEAREINGKTTEQL